jgi:hypothetical protein
MRKIALTSQPYQDEALLDIDTPIIGVAAGKRSGKSHVVICMKALYLSSLHPGKDILVASPTFGMTRRNLIPIFRRLTREMNLDVTGLEVKGPSNFTVRWGDKVSTIHLDVTIENCERMNGMSLAAVFADEIDMARHEDALNFLEEALIRLSDPYPGRRAQLNICGAPELNGAMAEYFLENPSPDKKLFVWSLMQNQCVSDEYKQRVIATIPASKQRGWVYGEFMFNTDGLVYEDFDPDLNMKALDYSEVKANEDIHVSWDINDGGTSVVIGVRRGNYFFIIDEWMKMAHTKAVLDKVKKQPWANQAVITCDPACTQVFAYIVESGLRFRIMRAAPEIEHTVTAVNGRFCTAGGARFLFIHPRCKVLKKCLMRQSYINGVPDKKTPIPEAGTDISGPIDALRYLVYREYPFFPTGHGTINLRGF